MRLTICFQKFGTKTEVESYVRSLREPDWNTVTEDQLWKYVGWHLAKEGIESFWVGGAVVSILP